MKRIRGGAAIVGRCAEPHRTDDARQVLRELPAGNVAQRAFFVVFLLRKRSRPTKSSLGAQFTHCVICNTCIENLHHHCACVRARSRSRGRLHHATRAPVSVGPAGVFVGQCVGEHNLQHFENFVKVRGAAFWRLTRRSPRADEQLIVASTAYTALTLAWYEWRDYTATIFLAGALCAMASFYGCIHCSVGHLLEHNARR